MLLSDFASQPFLWLMPLCLSQCASYSLVKSPQALEKNKQWLNYDQQREAYVKAILAKMLWLEKHLNEANQARLLQHNEEHSNGESKRQWAVDIHHKGNKRSQQGFLRCQDFTIELSCVGEKVHL